MKFIWETLRLKNETLWYFGLICLVGSLICLILVKTIPNTIQGVSGWMKPFKFLISTTLMAWTMGFYLHYIENQVQVKIYSWSLILLLSLEIALITYQASKGTLSHFNQENETGKIIFSIMALAITLFMIHTAFMGGLFHLQYKFDLPDFMVLSIKIAILITVLFAFEGFLMGAFMKHTVGADDGTPGIPVVNWSTTHGDLRVAHFFGMHALQIIPLFSYLIAKTKRDVVIIASIYFLFITFTLIQALKGKSLLQY